MKPIKKQKLTTDCIDCVFAEFEENSQTSCKIGRVKKYEEQGFSVNAVIDEVTEKEYKQIEGVLCSLNRSKDWIEFVVGSKDPSEVVYEEAKIAVGYFIDASEFTSYSEIKENIESTVESMPEIGKKSFITIFIGKNLKMNEIIELSATCESFTGINTKVVVENPSLSDSKLIDGLDNAFSTLKNGYLVCVKAGEKFTINPEEKINNAIVKDLKSVSYFDSDETFSGYAFSTFIFKNLRGNRGIPLKEKIKEMEKHYKQRGIYSWSEV
jgi:hypothetical protein